MVGNEKNINFAADYGANHTLFPMVASVHTMLKSLCGNSIEVDFCIHLIINFLKQGKEKIMERKDLKFYETPEMEEIEVKVQAILCVSGEESDLDDDL